MAGVAVEKARLKRKRGRAGRRGLWRLRYALTTGERRLQPSRRLGSTMLYRAYHPTPIPCYARRGGGVGAKTSSQKVAGRPSRHRHTRPASTHKCEPTRSLAGSLSPPRMAGFGYCAPGAKNPDGRGPFHVSLGSEMLPLSWGAHPLKEHAGGTHGLKY